MKKVLVWLGISSFVLLVVGSAPAQDKPLKKIRWGVTSLSAFQ